MPGIPIDLYPNSSRVYRCFVRIMGFLLRCSNLSSRHPTYKNPIFQWSSTLMVLPSPFYFFFNRFSNDKSFMKYDINGLFLDF